MTKPKQITRAECVSVADSYGLDVAEMAAELFFCRFNTESPFNDPDIAATGILGFGMYCMLRMRAFKKGEEGLPADEYQLRAMIGFHTDAEWGRVWPTLSKQFEERDGRLFIEDMLQEHRRALLAHMHSVGNGKKGGRPSNRENPPEKKAKGESPGFSGGSSPGLTHPTSNNTTIQRSKTPTPNAQARESSTPEHVGDIDFLEDVLNEPLLEDRLRVCVGAESWRMQGSVFKWAVETFYADMLGIVQNIEDSMNPEASQAKGISKPDSNGAVIRAKITALGKHDGIKIPTNKRAKSIMEAAQ